MPEEILWTGSSSQMKNFGTWAGRVRVDPVRIAMMIRCKSFPFPFSRLASTARFLWRQLESRAREFRLSPGHPLVTGGLFSKTTPATERYQVRALRKTHPFFLRLTGLENLRLLILLISQ